MIHCLSHISRQSLQQRLSLFRCSTDAFHLLPPAFSASRARPRLVLLLTLLLTSVLSFPLSAFLVSEAHAGDVQYVYDDLGRLSAVVDSTTNEAAIYQYDAVGNLLGIVRQLASTLAILNFTPKSGPVGTTATVAGIGFSTTASQNTVTFNGTPATVTSATTTQLVVTVPTGATTGPIAVTTPSGSASSSTSFTVTSGSTTTLPTITSFTPTVGAPGTPVTISGGNFATPALDNHIIFNTAQALTNTATPTSLTTSVPAAATSGPITVITPAGSGVSATDFFVPPAPYTASAVAVTARLNFGQSQTVTLSTANTIALLLLNASAGHRIGVNIANVTLSSSTVSITNSYGLVVVSTPVTTAGAFVESPLLTLSGTYTIAVIPTGTAIGSMILTPNDIVDLTGPITSGTAMTVNLATPGQDAFLTFNATAGQRVSVHVTNSTIGTCNSGGFSFREPDGTPWVEVGGAGSTSYITIGGTPCSNTFMDAKIFPQTGMYQFVLDPTAANTGQITLTLYIFDDIVGTLSAGTPTNVTITTPGQDARLTFANTAGQQVFIEVNSMTLTPAFSHSMVLLKADGNQSSTSLCVECFFDTTTLTTAGTTTLWLKPNNISTGPLSVTLYTVTDVTGTITPGVTTAPIVLSTPGQKARLTFTGTAGERASVRITSSTFTTATANTGSLRLLKPDGTTLATVVFNTAFLDAVTLPATGTYTVEVDPYGSNTGQMTLTLYVFSDVTGTLTVNGPSVTVTTTVPGQRGLLTFDGTATQQLTIRLTGNTMGTVSLRVRKPDGTVMVTTSSSGSSFTVPQQTLPVAGTYTVEVDPNNPLPINTGNITVSVTSP